MSLKRILYLMLATALAGCATQPKEPPRLMMNGFSISVPKEKEPRWIVAKQGPDLTVIGKLGRFSGETFTMQATVITLQPFSSTADLLRQVENAERKELDPKRFRVFKVDVKEQKVHGQSCALSRAEAAERMMSDGTGSPVNVMLESITLLCPHPKDAARGINLAYSHRHYPEDVDPQFAEDAALLMNTLQFEPL
ncbi:MAG TPA: hypothetical protein VHB46_21215 [Burkholderiales bacterium]|nr:hypothetical protein [Burkholderiales bacterium]